MGQEERLELPAAMSPIGARAIVNTAPGRDSPNSLECIHKPVNS